MCYPVCGMMHIKEPLLLIGKNSPCGVLYIKKSCCDLWDIYGPHFLIHVTLVVITISGSLSICCNLVFRSVSREISISLFNTKFD